MHMQGYVNRDGIFRIKGERVAVGANEVPVDEMFGALRKDLAATSSEFRAKISEHTEVLDGYVRTWRACVRACVRALL
jgi:hypothetical protein